MSILVQMFVEVKTKIFRSIDFFKSVGVHCVVVFYWFSLVGGAEDVQYGGIKLYEPISIPFKLAI